MAELRAGLIGLGMMGRNHARVLDSMDGVDFVVAADASGAATSNASTAPASSVLWTS